MSTGGKVGCLLRLEPNKDAKVRYLSSRPSVFFQLLTFFLSSLSFSFVVSPFEARTTSESSLDDASSSLWNLLTLPSLSLLFSGSPRKFNDSLRSLFERMLLSRSFYTLFFSNCRASTVVSFLLLFSFRTSCVSLISISTTYLVVFLLPHDLIICLGIGDESSLERDEIGTSLSQKDTCVFQSFSTFHLLPRQAHISDLAL